MNKKSVYSCETCSALYVCLKYFQEHRKKHAIQEGRTIYPCSYCQTVLTSEHESKLHSMGHKNEQPHMCEVCQEMHTTHMLGISEEEVSGSRRSIGTATDFHAYNVTLDNNPNPILNGQVPIKNEPQNVARNNEDKKLVRHVIQTNEDEDVDDSMQDGDIDDVDDDDDDEDDDDVDDEDEDDEDEDDEDEDDEEDEEQRKLNMAQNVTIYVTQQTINHTTTHTSQQKNYLKSPRPSRSTGKGKGNRKARLTSDGDIRRKFSCCHCGKSFKTKSHLQRHILTHTGEKPYHCNRCDGRFNQSSSLRNHVIAIHTKEYPHICNNCSKGFLMPAVLQKHLQTSECGKITGQIVEGL